MVREDIPLDFRPKNSVGRGKERKEKGREEESRERGSTFSLDFPMIGPSVSGEARGKSFLTTRAASRDRKQGVWKNFWR